MALMFTATSSIKKAVGLINDLDSAKFPLILNRIIQKLHLKDERTFNEEEEDKLQNALGVAPDDLQLVLTTCEFFLQQAAYHTAKPAALAQQLGQLGLEEDKVQAIVDVWTTNARSVVEKLRQRTLAPKQLVGVNWRLNLQMGQRDLSKQKQPNAMFELQLKDEDNQKKEAVKMEFTHDELYAFYNKLEAIQSQIDGLS